VTAAKRRALAFVELRSEDPEAVSAFAVARDRLAAGRTLAGLRRLRVFELAGALEERDALAERLHGSTQFYNPAKERCTVRAAEPDPAPFAPEETLVLVIERGGERRSGAERWWRHEAGARVEVREGVVWALRFEAEPEPAARAAELAAVTDRAHGLLSNPQFQEHKVCADGAPPLDWLSSRRRARGARRPPRRRS
jgi:hypothetical protein